MAISKITSNSITDGGVTSADLASGAVEQAMTTQIGGRRNILYNGSFTVWQRGTSFTTPAPDAYSADRWQQGAEFGSIDVSRSTDAPDGFGYSLRIDVNSTGNPASSGQQVVFQQKIEAQDLQAAGFGSTGANALTMTFWVKCAITGTFPVWFYRPDNARHFAAHYTIDAVDTWEKKTISIPADTSGTVPMDNGEGLRVRFALDSDTLYTGGIPSAWEAINNNRYGSMTTTFMETATNYIQFTGVQLEVGSVATPFEHRSYGEELALCQRYFQKLYSDTSYGYPLLFIANATSSTQSYGAMQFITPMRTAPTFSYTGNFRLTDQGSTAAINGLNIDSGRASVFTSEFSITTAGGLTAKQNYFVSNDSDSSAALFLSAEL